MPAHVGRYDVIVPLGSGGMATVYLARDATNVGFDRLVAVKVLHVHLRGETAAAADFLREASIAARIKHPNVVEVIECRDEPEALYLVMSYVEGDAIAALTRRARTFANASENAGNGVARDGGPGTQTARGGEPIPLGVALRMIVDTLRGLHAAHELASPEGRPLALIHRDVTPQNVLVGRNGVSQLMDFGVARLAERTAMSADGVVKGKLRYMAPEQLVGRNMDRRVDLWAAGIMLVELLANRRYFEGQDDGLVLLALMNGPLPALETLLPSTVPAALLPIAQKALSRDPDGRFSSAAAFADALEETGFVGTHAAVAGYVEGALGDLFVAREGQIRGARTRSQEISNAATELADDEFELAAKTTTVTVNSALAAQRPRRNPFLGVAAAVVALIAVGLGGRSYMHRAQTIEPALLASSPVPVTSPPTASALPKIEAPELRTVTVVANAPLSALERVRDAQTTALAVPRGALRVALPESKVGDLIRGTTADGRHTEIVVASDKEVTLTFPKEIPKSRTETVSKNRDGLLRNFP